MNSEYNKKLTKIKKEYKNTEMLLDIYLENYHNNYIYIRIDYYKKLKTYKLSWIDLSLYNNNNFNSIINYEHIPDNIVSLIKNIISNINNLDLYQPPEQKENLVSINSNLLTKNNQPLNLTFYRYIHPKDKTLFDLFGVIFNNLPRKLEPFLQEISAAIIGNTAKYEYKEEFKFDLFQDNPDTLFFPQIIERGKEYHQQGRVLFLEKINDKYFSVVGGNSLYVIVIKYDETTKLMQIYCSCPCEFFCKHIYAVILAIRNNQFKKFYKITRNTSNINLLDKIMNFQFLLSIGTDDQGNNYLVIEDGLIKLLPIKNKNNLSEWEILEDDEKESLTKRIKEILNK